MAPRARSNQSGKLDFFEPENKLNSNACVEHTCKCKRKWEYTLSVDLLKPFSV